MGSRLKNNFKKVELDGKIMTELALLIPKTCSYLVDANVENKKAKCKKKLKFGNCEHCLKAIKFGNILLKK